MPKLSYSIAVFVLFLSFVNCQPTVDVVVKPQSPFFDLKSYFTEEMEHYKGVQCKKTVSIDGKKNTKIVVWDLLSEDLKLFQQFDPNKPALIDRYSRDTILTNSAENMEIRYTALDKKYPTQSVSISFINNEVDQVVLTVKKKNAIYQFEQKLEYSPGRGYSILKDQKVILSPVKRYEIVVKMVAS